MLRAALDLLRIVFSASLLAAEWVFFPDGWAALVRGAGEF